MPRLLPFLVVGVAMALPACELPPGDQSSPTEAHYQWIRAREAGDAAALWPLVDPGTQGKFAGWLAAEREAVRQVDLLYPADDKPSAMEALADGKRAKLASAEALFAALLAEGAPPPLGPLERLGARVRSVETQGDSADLTTWAGDRSSWIRNAGGDWCLVLDQAEQLALTQAARQAEANLGRVRAHIAALRGD